MAASDRNDAVGTMYRCQSKHRNKRSVREISDLAGICRCRYQGTGKDIYSTGFYKNKAKNIIGCAKKLISEYGGEVPSDIESLTKLDGVGRKTANVIRGNIYHEPSIVVDTHVKRISRLLGLTDSDDPVKIEHELMEKLPKEQWILYNIQIITLGRTICIARRPKCAECALNRVCPSANVTE